MNERTVVSKVNGYLHAATKELCDWLEKMLPRVTDEWWHECVLNNLSYAQRDLAENNGSTRLDQLDLAALLRVADKSWYSMRSFAYLPTSQRECVRSMMKVRNNWAHCAGSIPDKDMVIRDLEVILNFFETVIITNLYTEDITAFKKEVEQTDFSDVFEIPVLPSAINIAASESCFTDFLSVLAVWTLTTAPMTTQTTSKHPTKIL